jgi:protein-disulfide isomerase
MANNDTRMTRTEQREAARAKAKEIRETHKKSEQRRKYTIVAGVSALVLLVGALVGWAVVAGQPAPSLTPANLSYDNGIRIGKNLEAFTATSKPTTEDVPVVKMYLDYQCPVCKEFDVPNASLIEDKVASGEWIFEYHPISFLDGRGSPNTYSSRAANAAICVAENSPNDFLTFTNLLYANQPQEQTPGPENDQLIAFANQIGVSNSAKIETCINNKSYGEWIKTATDAALSEKVKGTDLTVDGTPFIVVNGQKYDWSLATELGSPARFEQWVKSAWATKN